ncbi:MAG: hypothetical protein KTV68_16315 [Acidimicrobiia bacterium]|nr:hypothetical protein [Acidimicrobiia bacterium]
MEQKRNQYTTENAVGVVQAVRSGSGLLVDKSIIAVTLDNISNECLTDDNGIDLLKSTSDGPKHCTEEDIIWAAETFISVVVPHILGGGTKQELVCIDSRNGNSQPLRQFAPIWDLYLHCTEMPFAVFDEDACRIALNSGRHRTRAAQVVGIETLPMQARSREEIEDAIDNEHLNYTSVEAYFSKLGTLIQ